MRRNLLIGFCLLLLVPFATLKAQDATTITKDTIDNASSVAFADSLGRMNIDQYNKNAEVILVKDFQPDPTKAVIYSAIFPGLGQIYNRKYWKLPLVYGGFMGVVYAVTWNGSMYGSYRDGYRDIMIDPYRLTRWHDLVLDPNAVLNDPSVMSRQKEFIKRRRDYFRRNRDLAIIAGVGLYALCMIDAYVDAHLYNFTVTPDLSMTVAPAVWGPSQASNSFTIGLQCNIEF